jgi:NAD(P)H-dependent flavin oxidoreductase YrpB (nitropropane dioxygenase family)
MKSLNTPFCKLLNIEYPIVQAPCGSSTCPELAAEVSNAGGLGMLALSRPNREETSQMISLTKTLTKKPFGVNFVLDEIVIKSRPYEEKLRVCIEEKIPLISFTYGKLTSELIKSIHNSKLLVAFTVWDLEQAIEAVNSGVDVLVAQGIEAGGHLNSKITTKDLTKELVQNFPNIPVLSAGGIATGQQFAEAINNGAQGIWIGTRFLATTESKAHEVYKQKILEAKSSDTEISTLFDIGWSNAPHRTIKNSTYNNWSKAGCPSSGKRPGEGEVIAHRTNGTPIIRYEDTPPIDGMNGDLEALALYAGTSVEYIDKIIPASKVLEELVNGAIETLCTF